MSCELKRGGRPEQDKLTISAFFSAGASLTPSPVMAETSPCLCRDFTIVSLSSGCARANTLTVRVNTSISESGRYFPSRRSGRSSPQSRAHAASSSSSRSMLTLCPMALAVGRSASGLLGKEITTYRQRERERDYEDEDNTHNHQ